jgi:hypothetical protein
VLKLRDDNPRNAPNAEKKDERARQAARAMQEYNARKAAILAKTEQLRALRLAKEAETGSDVKAKMPRTGKPRSIVA